ncbi:MAG: 5'/3'-nucleotidase SurE [Chitinophagales bacterium]
MVEQQERIILVTNDDGVTSKGIRSLIEAVSEFGKVVVVAPDKPQSGMGHAITISHPLRLNKVNIFGDIEAYACSGTPVDCVKLAIDKVLHRKPDLCVSGINHGSNSSINVIYSGTMSAAMEAAMDDIPAIGFSLLDFKSDADFEPSKKIIKRVVANFINNATPNSKLLNVNIPAIPYEDIKGIKICRQAKARWNESFDERRDPFDRQYFWLSGKFVNEDKGEDTDIFALEHNYVSVVPVRYDLTAYEDMANLNEKWELDI